MKYFHLGCAPDDRMPVYGLYSLYYECFVIVYHDLAICKNIKSLWSSRSPLFIVQISAAHNFTPTLVDNSVCTQWTFSNAVELDAMASNNNRNYSPVLPDTLEPCTGNTQETLQQDFELLQTILYWLLALEAYETYKYHYTILDAFVEDFLHTEQPYDTTDTYYNIRRQVFRVLYLENDINTVNRLIPDIIKTNSVMYAELDVLVPTDYL